MRIPSVAKRFLGILVAAVLLCSLLPMGTFTASAEKSGFYTYSLGFGKVTITDVDDSISGDITIPATLGGYPVTTIGEEAFLHCESLTSIMIPDSVTEIGDWAFEKCKSLTSITIPNSVTAIGCAAFSSCTSLTGIVIPNSVTEIGNGAFSGCDSLTSITVEEGNPTYHAEGNCLIETATDTLVAGCQTSVIPDSVTTIGDGAFSWRESLTSIMIPDSVTTIGDGVFYGCESLTSITIPDSVTTIGEEAFSYCESLTSITIPDSVTTIGEDAFSDCEALTDVWYIGESRDGLKIGEDNDELLNATWHYVTTCPDENHYTTGCDVNCDVCGTTFKTEPDHVYDDDQDADCNECGATRTIDETAEGGAEDSQGEEKEKPASELPWIWIAVGGAVVLAGVIVIVAVAARAKKRKALAAENAKAMPSDLPIAPNPPETAALANGYCGHCGNPFTSNDPFCSKCGHPR